MGNESSRNWFSARDIIAYPERYTIEAIHEKLPDITTDFFSFLSKERDNPESSFFMTIGGLMGTGRTTAMLAIAYTMVKSDPKRFVASLTAGRMMPDSYYVQFRPTGDEVDRRIRSIESLRDIHENDIILAEEFLVKTYDDPRRMEMIAFEKMFCYARHKRICALFVSSNVSSIIRRAVQISVTMIAPGEAIVVSEYKGFFTQGMVKFSSSPLVIEYKRVTAKDFVPDLKPVIACAHCLGIVSQTDEKCGYCGYSFETMVIR